MTQSSETALVERLNEFLVAEAKSADLTLIAAPNKHVTVKVKGTDQFKKVPTIGTEEFFFKEVRYGKRNTAIFVFEPASDVVYSIAEVELKHVADLLPGFSDFLIGVASELGCRAATVSGCVSYIEKHAAKLLADDKAVREAKERAAAAAENAGNELFGMF